MTSPGERYDPYIPKPSDGAFERPSTESIDLSDHAPPPKPKSKTERIQDELDATVEVMRENLMLAQERDFKTAELEAKSKRLQGASSQFKQASHKVKRRMWCKDMKWTFILICVILILIVAIVVPVVLKFVPPAQASTTTTTTVTDSPLTPVTPSANPPVPSTPASTPSQELGPNWPPNHTPTP